jgi:hypothetical protein
MHDILLEGCRTLGVGRATPGRGASRGRPEAAGRRQLPLRGARELERGSSRDRRWERGLGARGSEGHTKPLLDAPHLYSRRGASRGGGLETGFEGGPLPIHTRRHTWRGASPHLRRASRGRPEAAAGRPAAAAATFAATTVAEMLRPAVAYGSARGGGREGWGHLLGGGGGLVHLARCRRWWGRDGAEMGDVSKRMRSRGSTTRAGAGAGAHKNKRARARTHTHTQRANRRCTGTAAHSRPRKAAVPPPPHRAHAAPVTPRSHRGGLAPAARASNRSRQRFSASAFSRLTCRRAPGTWTVTAVTDDGGHGDTARATDGHGG